MFTLHLHRRTAPPTAAGLAGRRRVNVWRDDAEVACAFGYRGEGWWAMEWPGWAIFRFGSAVGAGVEVTCRADVPLASLEDTYRRSVVPLQFQALGHEALHASAVSGEDGVIAFCGERRAGKSTLAFALGRLGLPQRADDSLVLEVSPTQATAIPLPFAPRLRQASADFFRTDRAPRPTSGVAPAERLRAVFELNQDDTATCSVEPLDGGEAFSTLLAHAHCFDPDDPAERRRLVDKYLTLAAVTPVFRVRYAPRLTDLSSLAHTVLGAAGARIPVAP